MRSIIILFFLTTGCLNMNARFKKGEPEGKRVAACYPIVANKPTPDFFEGALMGNGGLGVVLTTRPDAVCLHFGHNNVWDIRITENHKDKIGTFKEIFAKASLLPDTLPTIHHDKEFSDYLSLTADNYRSSYPRPFPCGTLLLGFDRRKVELLGYELNISNGVCQVSLLQDGDTCSLWVRIDMEKDEVWLSQTDRFGAPMSSVFNRVRLIPDPSTPHDIPHYQMYAMSDHDLGFYQELPFSLHQPTPGKDKAFALQIATNRSLEKGQRTTTLGIKEDLNEMERYIAPSDSLFLLRVRLTEGLVSKVRKRMGDTLPTNRVDYEKCQESNERIWNQYWSCSSVNLSDKDLEKIWYRNMYFFNCALREGVTCPGIFANWSYGSIGTAWHGDYHLNYNTQQPFWVTFSSNHLEKNLVYADLVDHLLPVSRKWAREYYGMRGAFFPHSAYPVEMNLHPYPVPDWGWEVFETPWMVQGLWWHYLYSRDESFLRERAFIPIKDAVLFLTDYMTRSEAHGSAWNDDKYHIFPSVPPELYGLQPGFKYNYDTQIDIALAKFVFKAYLKAVDVLKISDTETDLVNDVKRILSHMPDYPVFDSEDFGRIYVSVPGEKDEIIYNVPANLTHVFPGEEYGLSAPDSIREILLNTCKAHQNEGGNEIVFLNMQKARLGNLDLEQFKRQVHYATLPNQTVTDAVLQVGGRYNDMTDYFYMGGMGIWFENFALPAVINECLMQSYDGVIRFFPNWPRQSDACFSTLRACGAFLVSASVRNDAVCDIRILSERGGKCEFVNPWKDSKVRIMEKSGKKIGVLQGEHIAFNTKEGCEYIIESVDDN